MAGSTGSSVSSEFPPAEEGESQRNPTQDETYSLRFINHAPEPLQTPSFIQLERTDTSLQPSNGFALKKASRKRVVFSLEQKEILISFYNRQATTGIRAEPKDVIACMQTQGVEVLKESQITNWWSSYHQKRKRLLTAEADHLRSLHPSSCNSGSTNLVQQPTPVCSTVPVQHPTPPHTSGSTVPVQQPNPDRTSSSTVPVQQPNHVRTSGSTVPAQQPNPPRTSGSNVSVQQPNPPRTSGSNVPVQQPNPPRTSGSTVPVQQPNPAHTSGSTVPVQQPNPVRAPASTFAFHATGSTVSMSQPTAPHSRGLAVSAQNTSGCYSGTTVSIQPNRVLIGYPVPGLADILQWTFPVNFCQSTLGGRSGSNACTFIALYFGHLFLYNNLSAPLDGALSTEWGSALYMAMVEGNKIHDELFEGEGVDVAVDEAVEMAGAECFVQSIGQSLDLFGLDCVDQLAAVFEMLTRTQQSSCNVIVTQGRSFLFIVNQDGSSMIVDSHRHGTVGAVIAHCPPNSVKILAKWLEAMLLREWQCDLRICSVTPIFYIIP